MNELKNWTKDPKLAWKNLTQTCCGGCNCMDRLSLKQGQKQEHEDREGTALLKRLTEQSLLEKCRLKGNAAVTMPWLASA